MLVSGGSRVIDYTQQTMTELMLMLMMMMLMIICGSDVLDWSDGDAVLHICVIQ